MVLRGCGLTTLGRPGQHGGQSNQGDQGNPGGVAHVVCIRGGEVRIDNCGVRGGHASGGGIMASGGAKFHMSGCEINAREWGVCASGAGGKGTVRDCSIGDSRGAGLLVRGGVKVRAEGCIFAGNAVGVRAERCVPDPDIKPSPAPTPSCPSSHELLVHLFTRDLGSSLHTRCGFILHALMPDVCVCIGAQVDQANQDALERQDHGRRWGRSPARRM